MVEGASYCRKVRRVIRVDAIAFIRASTRIDADDHPFWQLGLMPNSTGNWYLMAGRKTVLVPLFDPDSSQSANMLLFETEQRPEWVEFCEIVEYGGESANKQSANDDLQSEDFCAQFDIGTRADTFGRRMVTVVFEVPVDSDERKDTAEARAMSAEHRRALGERTITETRASIRKALGPSAASLWEDDHALTIAFVDRRSADRIAEGLSLLLDRPCVKDFVLFSFGRLLQADQVGLSRLETWISDTLKRRL